MSHTEVVEKYTDKGFTRAYLGSVPIDKSLLPWTVMFSSSGRTGDASTKDLAWLEAAHACLSDGVGPRTSYAQTISHFLSRLRDLFGADRACFLGPFHAQGESCFLHYQHPQSTSPLEALVIVTPSLDAAMRSAQGADAAWTSECFDPSLRFDDVKRELHLWVDAGALPDGEAGGALVALQWQTPGPQDPVDARLFAGLARRIGDQIASSKLLSGLAKSEAILETIWQSSSMGLAVVEADGRCTKVNPLACEWLGRSAVEILHTLAPDWLPEHLASTLTSWSGELPTAGGGHRDVAMTKTPVPGVADVLTLLEVSDQSSLKRLERELYEVQKHKLFGTLSAGVVHDLNNLMTVVVAALDMATNTPASRYLPELLGDAKEAVRRCSTLCRQLQMVGRTRPGTLQLVQPDAQLAAMKRLLSRVLHDDTRFDLTLEAPTGVLDLPMGALQQIMINLLVNAREAMGEGGGVEIRTYLEGDRYHIEVKDDGKGMSEEVLERIFEPFFSTKKDDGSGVGLAVVHRLVSQAGGHIEAQSAEGRGTRIDVSFEQAALEPPRAYTETAREWRGDGLIAVVCENEPVLRDVIARTLGERGFEVVSAPDGRRAQELLTGGHGFDLLVTDLVMPNSGGIATALACNQGETRTPVVFLSGLMDASALPELAVATTFLAKPFRMGDLLSAVQSVLGAARLPAATSA